MPPNPNWPAPKRASPRFARTSSCSSRGAALLTSPTSDGSIASARQELTVAQRDVASLERLQARSAATAEEVRAARDRADRAAIQIKALESRRQSLVAATDIAGAEARLREAEATVNAARTRISMATGPRSAFGRRLPV